MLVACGEVGNGWSERRALLPLPTVQSFRLGPKHWHKPIRRCALSQEQRQRCWN